MKHEEKILAFYNEQLKFGYIESLTIHKNIEEQNNLVNNLKISFFSYPYTLGDKKLVMDFQNVKDLKIKDLDGLFKTVLSITDISSYQMEGINYRIVEDENSLFSFECKNFDFSVLDTSFEN